MDIKRPDIITLILPNPTNSDVINALYSEIERLRILVKHAYEEGYSDGKEPIYPIDYEWARSEAAQSLDPTTAAKDKPHKSPQDFELWSSSD